MNQFGAEGLGFIPVYSAVLPEVMKTYDLRKFGVVKGAEIDLYAITAERKIRTSRGRSDYGKRGILKG